MSPEEIAKLNEGRDPGKYPVITGDGGPMKRMGELAGSTKEVQEQVLMDLCEKVVDGMSLWKYATTHRYPKIQFSNWVRMDEERYRIYKDALDLRAEYHAQMIADEMEKVNNDNWQAKRLLIQSHQWFASRYNRMQYGDDKNQIGVSVGNITIVHESA